MSARLPHLSLTVCFSLLFWVLLTHAHSETPFSDIASIRRLSKEQADEARPLRIRGVLTYYDSANHLAFVQDSSGATYLKPQWSILEPAGFSGPILPGLLIEAEGTTNGGRFAPHLSTPNPKVRLPVRILGTAPIPPPMRPPRAQLLDPKYHSQWIELDAFATDVRIQKDQLTLSLVFGGHKFDASILGTFLPETLPPIADSDIQIRGVFGSLFNEARQLTGMRLYVPSMDHVSILDPQLKNAFTQPTRAISEITQFSSTGFERMRVQGSLTFQDPGHGFYLKDDTGAVWVEDSGTDSIPVGTCLDIVAFATIDHQTPVLKDPVLHRGPQGPLPAAIPVDAPFAVDIALHGQLVKIDGIVLERLNLPSHRTLVIQSGNTVFNATFATYPPRLNLPERGSTVAVTGICRNISIGAPPANTAANSTPQTDSFNILMRDHTDLLVLSRPSWWTSTKLLYLACTLSVCIAVALLWAITLKRQVRAQSSIIAEKRSAERVSEERTRIARELHDTLEQHLSGVAIQLEAAAAQLPNSPTLAHDSLSIGAAMLRHSRTEARRSVWDLRSQQLEQNGLLHTLHELADSMSSAACPVFFSTSGNPRSLDPHIEFHLLRIAQEALANSLKHSRASQTTLSVLFQPNETTLQIQDNGIGFHSPPNPGTNGGHFGLLGIRERTSKLRAVLNIQSAPTGTTLTVTIPTAT